MDRAPTGRPKDVRLTPHLGGIRAQGAEPFRRPVAAIGLPRISGPQQAPPLAECGMAMEFRLSNLPWFVIERQMLRRILPVALRVCRAHEPRPDRHSSQEGRCFLTRSGALHEGCPRRRSRAGRRDRRSRMSRRPPAIPKARRLEPLVGGEGRASFWWSPQFTYHADPANPHPDRCCRPIPHRGASPSNSNRLGRPKSPLPTKRLFLKRAANRLVCLFPDPIRVVARNGQQFE